MVKSRRKKNEKKDFQKVKLKIGKTLKKADNVTDTNFKSRRINIKEQLTTDKSQPSTKRKLNITDLLSHLQHYSSNVRHDAVNGLRELFADNPALLHLNLATVIERVSPLFVDKVTVVRQSVHKLLAAIFPCLDAMQMSPFFPILNAHLCCAMTHIYDDVKSDSLPLIDLCLDCFPTLVIRHCSQILSNFINMISKQSKVKGLSERILSINPSGKLQGQKWRQKVLERLYKILSACFSHFLEKEDAGVLSVFSTKDVDCRGNSAIYHCVEHPCPFESTFTLRSIMIQKQDEDELFHSFEKLAEFVKVLVPLLLQIWVECSPSQNISILPGTTAAADRLRTMLSVLKVVKLLLECMTSTGGKKENVDVKSVSYKFQKDFVQHFMQGFPFPAPEAPVHVGKKGKKKPIQLISTLSLNLFVCDIMSYYVDTQSASQSTLKIANYIDAVNHDNKLTGDDLSMTLKILRRLINVKEYTSSAVSSAWMLYQKSHPLSTERLALIPFFSKHLLSCDTFTSHDPGLAALPGGLLETLNLTCDSPVIDAYLAAMKIAVSLKRESVVVEFSNSLLDILGISDKKSMYFVRLSEKRQRCLIELIVSLTHIDNSVLTGLLLCCRDPSVDITIVHYLIQVLNYRMIKDGKDYCPIATYFSFLLSLTLVHLDAVGEEVDCVTGCYFACQPPTGDDVTTRWTRAQLDTGDDVTTRWTRAQNILKQTVSSLNLWRNDKQIRDVVSYFIEQMEIDKTTRWSIISAFSTMNLILAIFSEELYLYDRMVDTLAHLSLSLASTLVSAVISTGDSAVGAELSDDIWERIQISLCVSPSVMNEFVTAMISMSGNNVERVGSTVVRKLLDSSDVRQQLIPHKTALLDWLRMLQVVNDGSDAVNDGSDADDELFSCLVFDLTSL